MRWRSIVFRQKKLDTLIMLCIFIYIAWMFFYGIIIKFTIGNSFLFTIKTYVSDMMLVMIIALCFVKKKTITRDQFLFFGFIMFVIAINFIVYGLNQNSITALLYTIRGFIAPMIAGYHLCNVVIDQEFIDRFFRKMFVLSIIFLLGNILLSVLQARNGYMWASQFYTGYSFFGTDQYSRIRITMASGLLRAPGLPASFTSSAMYSLISMAVILTVGKNRLLKVVSILLAAVGIWFTYNKTVLILFVIVLIMHLFSNMPRSFRYTILLIIVGALLFAFILVTTQMGIGVDESDLTFSTLARVEFWLSIRDIVSPLEVLLPYNMFKYTAIGEGMLACWDNFYLYALFSFGIIGFYCFLKLSIKMVKENIKKGMTYYNFYIHLAIMFYFAAIFNNVSNGKSFLGIFILLNGMVWKSNKNKNYLTKQ